MVASLPMLVLSCTVCGVVSVSSGYPLPGMIAFLFAMLGEIRVLRSGSLRSEWQRALSYVLIMTTGFGVLSSGFIFIYETFMK